MASRGSYGIDAPPVVLGNGLGGIAVIVLGIVVRALLPQHLFILGAIINWWANIAGGVMVITALLMIFSSTVGKFSVISTMIDRLGLKGDETIADLGCGRGLVMITAARKLTTGKAIGVDIWQSADQSGNRQETTLENARTEGVFDRVEVRTADMQHLPFDDGSVDVVVASLSIHNIYNEEGRAKAVREAARVLKKGGRVSLLDFQKTAEYEKTLRELGWTDVQRSGFNFLMFPPVRIVTGSKP